MPSLNRSLKIGSLQIPNRALLAPLAGVSDVPFRRICSELGAGLTFVEMLNANAVLRGNRTTMKTLQRHRDEDRLGVQVTGPTPEGVAAAVEVLDREGFDMIDINMGCPVRKIVARGSGSAMLRDPERLAETVSLARAATRKPLSVKVRLGFSRETVNIGETAALAARADIDMFTVHGRTRSENYGTPVDFAGIRTGLDAARRHGKPTLVTVGNGDIMQRDAAYKMASVTGCDAVMVSRGALGNPWIFPMILDPARAEPTLEEWLDVVRRHLAYHEEFYGTDKYAVVLTRKHLLWYANGFPDARRFRDRLAIIEQMDEANALLKQYVTQFPAGLRRYEAYDTHAPTHRRPSRYDPKFEMDRRHDRGVAHADD